MTPAPGGGRELLPDGVAAGLDPAAGGEARQALRYHQALLEELSDAILLADAETGLVLDCNRQAERLLARSRTDLIGRPQTELHPPDQAERMRQIFREHVESPGEPVSLEVFTGDGRTVPVSVKASLLELSGRRYLLGVFRDLSELRQEQLSRRTTEERYELAVLGSPDLTILQDPDGTITYVSPQVMDVVGYTAEQLQELQPATLIHPADRETTAKALGLALDGVELVDLRYRVVAGDGGIRWLSHTARPCTIDGTLIAIHSTIRDITDRERLAEELRWEVAVSRALARVSSALIASRLQVGEIARLVLEAARELTGSEHGYVSAIDPGNGDNVAHTFTPMMPRAANQEGSPWITFPRGADGTYAGLWGHALNTRQGFHTSAPQQHAAARGLPAGHLPISNLLSVPALIGDQLVGQILLAQAPGDYTDRQLAAVTHLADLYAMALQRRQYEEELHQREASAQAIFENVPIGIAITDAEGRFARASQYYLKLFGLESEEELLEHTVRDLTHSADRRATLMAQQALIRGEVDHIDLTKRYVRKDGSIFWGEASVSAVRDLDGTIRHFVVTVADITGRRQAEEERRRLEERLQESQKMEALGTLAGGIAHDFNNLLTSILGYADMLQETEDSSSQVREAAGVIEKAAVRAAELTRQLLGFARRGKLQNTPVDLHRVIQDTVSILSRTIDRRIEINLDLEASPSIVVGDPVQLGQVFVNLALNARDAMPDGGVMTISSRRKRLERGSSQAPPGLSPGSYLCLTIADTGVGMPPDVRERAFEPFFTTKAPGRGTGMGLAMVYGIVENHGGHLQLESEPGHGTTFVVCLPALEARPALGEPARPVTAVAGSGRILLVDDEEFVREVCSQMLQRLGYEVVTCCNGQEAVDFYRARGHDVDLVILDMTMPLMDGRECFQRLRELDPAVKVVVATGHAREGASQEVMELGALEFLQKPFLMSQVSLVVARALRGSEGEISPGPAPGEPDPALEPRRAFLAATGRIGALLQELGVASTGRDDRLEVLAAMRDRLSWLEHEAAGAAARGLPRALWHEFGNLLAGMRYYVSSMKGGEQLDSAGREAATALEAALEVASNHLVSWRQSLGDAGSPVEEHAQD